MGKIDTGGKKASLQLEKAMKRLKQLKALKFVGKFLNITGILSDYYDWRNGNISNARYGVKLAIALASMVKIPFIAVAAFIADIIDTYFGDDIEKFINNLMLSY